MTEGMTLRQRATLVEALSSSLEHGGAALGTVPVALRRLLAEEAWREFTTSRGEHVTYQRFADFVTMPPLKGLGSDVALVQRIVADDEKATALLREALKEKPGPKSSHNNRMRTRQGTTRSYSLERLRKDAPELHAEVLAGNLSAHAAMVKAGFRPRTFTVRADNPESAARSLRKHMPPDARRALARLLLDEQDQA
jgi:hypothetical protein